MKKSELKFIEHPYYADQWILISGEKVKSGDAYYHSDAGQIFTAVAMGYYDKNKCHKISASTIKINDSIEIITKEEIQVAGLITAVALSVFEGIIHYLSARLKPTL